MREVISKAFAKKSGRRLWENDRGGLSQSSPFSNEESPVAQPVSAIQDPRYPIVKSMKSQNEFEALDKSSQEASLTRWCWREWCRRGKNKESPPQETQQIDAASPMCDPNVNAA
jgi:hypothetical protein